MNNEELKQARLKFIEETLAPYLTDPTKRAVTYNNDKPICLYRAPNGCRCAIGQYIPDDKYDPCIEGQTVATEEVSSLLPPKIITLGYRFLGNVQLIHDEETYWDEDGLTTRGEVALKELKKSVMNEDFGYDHVESCSITVTA